MTKIADESCRFGGFDRGDTGRDDSFDAEAYLAEPPAPKPSLAKRVLASLGLFAGRSLTGLPNLNSMLPQFAGQHTTDKLRRNLLTQPARIRRAVLAGLIDGERQQWNNFHLDLA